MKIGKNLLFYLLIILAAVGFSYSIFLEGFKLKPQKVQFNPQGNDFTNWTDAILDVFGNNLLHPLSILVLQVIAIIFICRFFGFLFKRIGQPTVIGEITAGIVLGPSLFGSYFPEISGALFPKESLENLHIISQFGLILFMFVIGIELDIKVLKNRAQEALITSHTGILLSFSLGMILAYFLYNDFSPEGINFLSFGLFIGISMSITAFPVLARIIQERGLTKTKLGSLTLTCAAIDDITAWCMLACIIAIVKAGSLTAALFTIGFSILYVLLMFFIVRPFLRRVGNVYTNKETISKSVIALVFLIMLISSYITEILGIHALVGAFLAGVIMPPNINFRKILIEKTEDIGLVLLLPLFFVFTGLRTEIGLINNAHLWLICGIIILFAIAGKFLGTFLSAKFVGQSWKDSLCIGTLMNSRGLMELIVLNIGYDLGILGPEIFSMLVIMAIFTTFMTGPTLNLIDFLWKDKRKTESKALPGALKILISFGHTSAGRKLLRLAYQMGGKSKAQAYYSAIHITTGTDVNILNAPEFEKESFRSIRAEAERLYIPVETHYKMTNDLHKEVFSLIDAEKFDLLLVGAEKSIYTGTLLGNLVGVTKALSPDNLIGSLATGRPLFPTKDQIDEKSRIFAESATCDVGIFIDVDFSDAKRIFLPLQSEEDFFLFDYAKKFCDHNDSKISIVDFSEKLKKNYRISREISELNYKYSNAISMISDKNIEDDFIARQDLMVTSYSGWKNLVDSKSSWINDVTSSLVIKRNSP